MAIRVHIPSYKLNGKWRLNPADVVVYLTNHRNYQGSLFLLSRTAIPIPLFVDLP